MSFFLSFQQISPSSDQEQKHDRNKSGKQECMMGNEETPKKRSKGEIPGG